ncbi:unnamed protein product [Soboliphyme baturini]|uniref:Uncharacterized protein n=1 Tax=Soboliphyme baturini TaxID=241478 RepID=A0A183IPX0_9BILA|nr:unnamed protein product [Soboliphyme baturini]
MGFQITGRSFDEMQQSAIDMLLESSSETSAARKEISGDKGSSAAGFGGIVVGTEMRRGDSKSAEQVHSPITEEEEAECEKSIDTTRYSGQQAEADSGGTNVNACASTATAAESNEGRKLCEYFNQQQKDSAQKRPPEMTGGKDAPQHAITYQLMHMSYYADDKAVTAAGNASNVSPVKLRAKSWKSKLDAASNGSDAALRVTRCCSTDIEKIADRRCSVVKTKAS